MYKTLISCIIIIVLNSCTYFGSFELHPQFNIYINDTNSVPIAKALEVLQRDIKNVLGKEANIITDFKSIKDFRNGVIIINGEDSNLHNESLDGFERHKLFTIKNNLILQGSDVRGTIYAIYTFSEKFLGIKPLWYWASNTPKKKESISISQNYSYDSKEPYVRYRAWFPNDTDLFTPWRNKAHENNELWLETMLRLKLNTVEVQSSSDYSQRYAITSETKLINEYGLNLTFHHTSGVNSPYNSSWDLYWKQIRKMEPPALLLSNTSYIEEFWRYNIKCLVENGINPLWVVNFRGDRDIPFWRTFKDAPESMADRAAVINKMVERQVEIIKEETGNKSPLVRMIFYDELSDFLAEGLLHPPMEKELVWNFVAARRDHFPNDDIQKTAIPDSIKTGYYMNFQFTSTGSHFAQAEGLWKMEKNYRYVNSKNKTPIFFSVANAGNIREHLLELSANSEMLWSFKSYNSDKFLRSFCAKYYGEEQAESISKLYKEFFYSYWNQKKNDLEGFERQYVFQDLRYKQAISQLSNKFFEPTDLNPLEDFSWEQMPNRTFRIVPSDNHVDNQIEAIITGSKTSYNKFRQVTTKADSLMNLLDPEAQTFFNDNLRSAAYFMMYINETLYYYSKGYLSQDEIECKENLSNALNAAMNARESIFESAHDQFEEWYSEEQIYDIDDLVSRIDKSFNKCNNNHLNSLKIKY